MFYDIFYKCAACGNEELVQSHIQLDSADYDGQPLTDFYFPDAMNKVMSETRHACEYSGKPQAEGFYVRTSESFCPKTNQPDPKVGFQGEF